MSNPITINKGAYEEILVLTKKPENQNKFLRLGVKGGGCSGLSYMLEFDIPSNTDDIYTQDDLKFIVQKSHIMYINGMEVDFEKGLNSRGFVYKNPNAKTTCGCGVSFSA